MLLLSHYDIEQHGATVAASWVLQKIKRSEEYYSMFSFFGNEGKVIQVN